MLSNALRKNQTNLPWNVVLQLDESGSGPLHQRLRCALQAAIRAGRLPTGSTLPPSRMLAADLGCSRWVVTEVYGQLIAQGYLEARTGSATRVKWSPSPRSHATPRQLQQEFLFNLSPGIPDLRAFPRRTWAAAIRAEVGNASYLDLYYPPNGGHPRLRWVLADYLTRLRGAAVEPDDLILSTGIVDGIARMSRALARAGVTTIGVEEPGWPRVVAAVRSAGLTPLPVPVDGHGLRIDELASQSAIQAVIIAPAHQVPTGTVLAPARRAAVLDWARKRDGVILEDDYDAEFRYDRRPIGVMQGVDPSHVVLLGSVSKTLAPALRIGWIAAPARWTQALREETVPSPEPPTLDQLSLATFIETGSLDRHLRSMRRRYRIRRDTLVRALRRELPECRVSGAAAGLHLFLHLPDGVDSAAVVQAAALRGVRVSGLHNFRMTSGGSGDGLVLGYGSLSDESVDDAAHELALAVRG